MMKKLDLIFGTGISLIGLGHVLSVFYFFRPLVEPGAVGPAREPSLWWMAGGVGFCFTAALNFLRIRYSSTVPALNAVCLPFNAILVLYVSSLLVNAHRFLPYLRVPLFICAVGLLVCSALALNKNRLEPR